MRRRPAPPTIRSAPVAVPLGGVNAVSARDMPFSDCIFAANLIPGEHGLRARSGSREWCTGLTGDLDTTVRTTMGFRGSTKNGAADKLFACTDQGIWDVTASSAAPSRVLTFASSTGFAGWGVCHGLVNVAGHFLFYADEVNGLHRYDESTGLWATAPGITGVSAASIVFVTVFKNRLWMVERDTGNAWYLDAGAIAGAATRFELGTKFRSGGDLRGLWSWTYDGGAGIDDSLVAISGGGDVVIYQGTDPASATTFGLKGVWHVGAIPAGRRIATQYGGDVLIHTALGGRYLSKLVVGADEDASTYATAKIGPRFQAFAPHLGTEGWGFVIHPADNALLALIPNNGAGQGGDPIAMSFATKGWFPYRDFPIVSGDVWAGDLYFGTDDGRVMRAIGSVDGVTLADADAYEAVEYSLITRYDQLGGPNHKQVAEILPIILSGTASPVFEATARYDFDLLEPSEPSGTVGAEAGVWDSAVWDTAIWGADYSSTQTMSGATGMGRYVAVALRGEAIAPTAIVGIDVFFRSGGLL